MVLHRHLRRGPVVCFVLVLLIFVAAVITARSQAPDSAGRGSAQAVKPDERRARDAFEIGQAAEQQQNWPAAYVAYDEAAQYAPGNRDYALRREAAKAALVQARLETAERDAVSGRYDDARRELLAASALDPTNTILTERLGQLPAAGAPPPEGSAAETLSSGPQLAYRKERHRFDFHGDTRGAYDEVARQFGVDDAFDSAVEPRAVRFTADDVDFPTAMRMLGVMTGTFWQPLTSRLFLVIQDTPEKRRELGASAIRSVQLPNSASPDQMTETLRVLRDITGITEASLDTSAHAITLHASPQALAVASQVIDSIEKPRGEMVIEMEILEVDRDMARRLGITPPQTVRAFTLSPQQIQQASESATNLVNVINQIFGLPTSLAGLTPTQIAGLLASGNLSASSLLPPLVAFGGGQTTFLATLPGAAANFSEALALVKHGDRIYLRADDGLPATFFIGEHFPVALASYSSSLSGPSIPGVSSTNFPTTKYAAGKTPQFVTASVLRSNSSVTDLIVANRDDGTVGVLLGNGTSAGDGTFAHPAAYRTDATNALSQPVWVATADLNGDGHPDLVVANKASNNIGILLGSSAGDGTFGSVSNIPTGRSPVSVVSGLFHDATTSSHVDLAVANQGDNTISVFRGNGDGTFAASPTLLQLPSGYLPAGLAAADLNADGHTDLIVADSGNNTVSVFPGNGDGTFQPRTDYSTGNSPVYVAAADLNADGALDLAIANNGAPTPTNSGNSVTILLGQKNSAGVPNGTFVAGTTRDYPAGTAPTSLVVGDFNIDGLPDIVVADGANASTGAAGEDAISALIGSGAGSFSSNFELPVGTNPQSIVTGDFNGDNKLDIATADAGSNDITVVLNSTSVFNGGGNNGTAITPFPNVQYVDIGFKVKATPRIHNDGDVTLDMDLSLTSLSAQNFNSIPAINNESVQQTVRLREGQANVVASFLSPQRTGATNGTPGVAGLPGLGWLAQNQNAADQNTEIVVLVTPRMVRVEPRENRVIYAGPGVLPNGSTASVAAPPFVPQPGAAPAGAPFGPQPGQPPPAVVAPGQEPSAAPPNPSDQLPSGPPAGQGIAPIRPTPRDFPNLGPQK